MRWNGARENRIDYFDDENELTEWESQGLGGTAAAARITQVRETIVPEGQHLIYHCNCGSQVSMVIAWPEVAMMAHGLAPDDPRFRQFQLTTDAWRVVDQGRFSPQLPCPRSCGKQNQLIVSKTDAERALNQGLRNGFVQRSPAYPRIQAALNGPRQRMGQPPL